MSKDDFKKEARDKKIVEWMDHGRTDDNNTGHYQFEDEVWWGYWHNGDPADGPITPPDVMFPTEEQAMAYATVVGKEFDTYVGPVVLDIQFRDNYQVPE